MDRKSDARRLYAINEHLLRRKAAKSSFVEWLKISLDPLVPQPHHLKIAEVLEALERREITRLLIFAPPGSAKSTLVSRAFPAWYLCRHPKHRLIGAANVQALANDFSERVRNDIDRWGPTLGLKVDPDHRSKESWQLTSGGIYRAVGVGTGVLGHRSELFLLDDPIKSAEAAYSLIERDATWRWFVNDVRSRWTADSLFAAIGTRWHEDDLFGRILSSKDISGEPWTVLVIPAEAQVDDVLGRQPGEFLWDNDPNYGYGRKVRQEKSVLSVRDYAALYQQTPVPEGGAFFEQNMIHFYDHAPPTDQTAVYAGADYAVTYGAGDFTCIVIVGMYENRFHVLELWRGQVDAGVGVDQTLDMCERWKPFALSLESGVIKNALAPAFERRMRERRVFVKIRPYTRKTDKAVMAQSLQAKAAFDGIWLPRHASWVPELMKELLSFPAGKTDDMVDALVSVSMLLHRMIGSLPEKEPERPPVPAGCVVLPNIWDEIEPGKSAVKFYRLGSDGQQHRI
jgi:predicted phage terminase large subunit-like protein